MMKGEAKGTPQQRVGQGVEDSFRKTWLPHDEAADAKLDQLIDQLDQVNWPKTGGSDPAQH